ncbi:MAG TPA: lysophospholipid acyltransferase family protein [Alphaproteobacteria bacterium]|nr:lysophospholipid acyltransferase family protein [Alphaproteobacteria bacterium]
MRLVRSLLYSAYLYLTMALVGLVYLPGVLITGRRAAASASHLWARLGIWGVRTICGMNHRVHGLENLPKTGPILVACKHQAMWETLFFMTIFDEPAIVLKKELLSLPIYGWYARIMEMIAVDREDGPSAIKELARQAKLALEKGRPIIIFPEGTRQLPGAPPDYKPGIALLYRQLGIPCIPAALNSGLFWQAHGIMRSPGLVTVEFLPPIAPGLDRKTFMKTLEDRIEAASARLLTEAHSNTKVPKNRLNAVNA